MTDEFTSCDDCLHAPASTCTECINCKWFPLTRLHDNFTPKKPRTIMIGDVEVVAGLDFMGPAPEFIYISEPSLERMYSKENKGTTYGQRAMERGLAHATPENAIAMSEATLKQLGVE